MIGKDGSSNQVLVLKDLYQVQGGALIGRLMTEGHTMQYQAMM